jgi:hypothetical protein
MNRYYDPARGRFTTPDPARSGKARNPLSFNRYAYVMGDPINKNDPSGFCADDVSDDGSDDVSDDDNGDTTSGEGNATGGGVGVGIGWDEIWGGDEMDEAAFGQHGRSKRRIGLLDNSKCNPTPACPAGQMRMSNGECDVPLSSGARQVVGQIAIDTSASNICSMLNGAAWGGVIAGGASFSTSVGNAARTGPGLVHVAPGTILGWGGFVLGTAVKVTCALVTP